MVMFLLESDGVGVCGLSCEAACWTFESLLLGGLHHYPMNVMT